MALESTRIWIFPRASSQSPSRIFVEQDRAVLPITQSFFKKTFVSGNFPCSRDASIEITSAPNIRYLPGSKKSRTMLPSTLSV